MAELTLIDLQGQCDRCVGLCCVALPFARSADFALDKPGGEPCPNLAADYRCRIHLRLRDVGFRGCTTYDCFGAGQQVSQVALAGRSWREDPEAGRQHFAVFPLLRHVYELRWYLVQAGSLLTELVAGQENLVAEVAQQSTRLAELSDQPAAELEALDLPVLRAEIAGLLRQVSQVVRSAGQPTGHRSKKSSAARRWCGPAADLMDARLAGADLRAVNLRGAYLIAADLQAADLRWADLIGADLRDADLRGANLSTALFLTRPQVAAARGDRQTRLPQGFEAPAHWV